jgi:hypothetical protein
MIKNITTINSSYVNKAFPKIKVYFSHTPLKLHVLKSYNDHPFLPLLPRYSSTKTILCSIQIQMVIKIV